MESFLEWLGIGVAVAVTVMVLSLFFSALPLLRRRIRGGAGAIVSMSELLPDDRIVEVILSDGRRIGGLRLRGFPNREAAADLPFGVAGLAVFEDEAGRRTLIRLEAIRVLREMPPGQDRSSALARPPRGA